MVAYTVLFSKLSQYLLGTLKKAKTLKAHCKVWDKFW